MRAKTLSLATLGRLLVVLVGLMVLAGCGGGSAGSVSPTPTSPAVTLSSNTLTFTSTSVGTPSAAQTLTVTNSGNATLTITSVTLGGANSGDFSLTSNLCVTSVGAGGDCTIGVIFTPAASGTRNGTLTITDNASTSPQSVNLTGTIEAAVASSNTAPVTVNFGPNGNQGPPTATTASYYNGIFTTVTLCESGTTTCQSIDNVLLDTGSVGLRVLSNQLGNVVLPSIQDQKGNVLYSCIEYGDLTYNWGPVQVATVQIGGETASQLPGQNANTGVPIQVITANATAPSGAQCTSGGGGSANTVALLGANGILGVGSQPQDCGAACTSSATNSEYLLCSNTQCVIPGVPLLDQVWNPVAAFSSADTNGVIVQLPPISDNGEATVAGSLVFGIGTETCPGSPAGCTPNGLGSAQVYPLDQYQGFSSVELKGVIYTSANNANYLDTGSNALFVSDASTLGITDCMLSGTDIGYYCPSATLNLTDIVFKDNNGVSSPPISLSIANALTLFSSNNYTFAAFNNLGGDSGTDPASDYFDFGLPFFFGRNIYFGIMGTTPPNNVSAPYGYWAF